MSYKIISKFIKDISFEIPNIQAFVLLEKEIYVNLVDQKTPKLNLENVEIIDLKPNDNINIKKKLRLVIKPNNDELQLHKKYLKSDLPKNYYN